MIAYVAIFAVRLNEVKCHKFVVSVSLENFYIILQYISACYNRKFIHPFFDFLRLAEAGVPE
jgi:hypothetical protein